MLPNQSKYLILDEPSASLDPKGIISLQKILTDLREKQVGILCIEHNLDAFKSIADRMLFLSNGRISKWENDDAKTPSVTVQPNPNQRSKQLLSLQNVSFSYDSHPVIQNVSLSLYSGEVIALMGSNGSGKTTLLSVLGGLLEPTSGRVLLESSSISNLDRKEVAKRISIVFQNPNHQIFEKTVWKEQTLTSEILGDTAEKTLDRSRNLLSSANLASYLDKNPFSLSHGQKRRLNVTSTLAHSPDLILLDEPFIGQDKDGREFILNGITDIVTNNGAVLVVTHNPIFAKNHCNRAIFIENGEILLDGPPQTVLDQLNELGHEEYSHLEVNN
jgi:energy-coupling factor transport system ATP-binding protein